MRERPGTRRLRTRANQTRPRRLRSRLQRTPGIRGIVIGQIKHIARLGEQTRCPFTEQVLLLLVHPLGLFRRRHRGREFQQGNRAGERRIEGVGVADGQYRIGIIQRQQRSTHSRRYLLPIDRQTQRAVRGVRGANLGPSAGVVRRCRGDGAGRGAVEGGGGELVGRVDSQRDSRTRGMIAAGNRTGNSISGRHIHPRPHAPLARAEIQVSTIRLTNVVRRAEPGVSNELGVVGDRRSGHGAFNVRTSGFVGAVGDDFADGDVVDG